MSSSWPFSAFTATARCRQVYPQGDPVSVVTLWRLRMWVMQRQSHNTSFLPTTGPQPSPSFPTPLRVSSPFIRPLRISLFILANRHLRKQAFSHVLEILPLPSPPPQRAALKQRVLFRALLCCLCGVFNETSGCAFSSRHFSRQEELTADRSRKTSPLSRD